MTRDKPKEHTVQRFSENEPCYTVHCYKTINNQLDNISNCQLIRRGLQTELIPKPIDRTFSKRIVPMNKKHK